MSLTKSRRLILNRAWTHNEKLHFPLPIAKFLRVGNLGPSGAPLLCAAASTAISNINIILREKLAENARKMGQYLLEGLQELQEKSEIIGDVRGKGLLVGIELIKNKKSRQPDKEKEIMIIEKCKERGLIVEGRCGGPQSVIILHPPLIVGKEHIDEALSILTDVILIMRQP